MALGRARAPPRRPGLAEAAVALLGATGRFDEAFVDAFRPEPTATSFGAMVARTLTDADGTLLLARSRLRACGVEWQVPA